MNSEKTLTAPSSNLETKLRMLEVPIGWIFVDDCLPPRSVRSFALIFALWICFKKILTRVCWSKTEAAPKETKYFLQDNSLIPVLGRPTKELVDVSGRERQKTYVFVFPRTSLEISKSGLRDLEILRLPRRFLGKRKYRFFDARDRSCRPTPQLVDLRQESMSCFAKDTQFPWASPPSWINKL